MKDLFDLNHKVAIITGAGGVLGGEAARYLAAQNVRVVLLGRTLQSLEKNAASIIDKGGNALGLSCDVLNRSELEAVRDKVLNNYGAIDILINAAGGNKAGAVVTPEQTFFEMSMDDLTEVVDLNLYGSILPSMVFGETMVAQKSGVIINYSSMSVAEVITRVAGYSASKAAIENFTRWLAVEFAQKHGEGVRVNAIVPGFFIGDQNRKLLLNEDGSLTSRGESIIQNTPYKRFGEAHELNGTLHYLCAEASSFVTGAALAVDGGFQIYSGV